MKNLLLLISFLLSIHSYGQTTERYNSDYSEFYKAEDLFTKKQYGAAREEFRLFINSQNDANDPLVVKARYYEALSALELFNNDAIPLLEKFNTDYPESIYKKGIHYKIGLYYYYKKDFEDCKKELELITPKDIEPSDRNEYFFKLGYSNFKLKDFVEARNNFYEIQDTASNYYSPALYYFSHIAYQNKTYQVALDGFLKLEDDPKFGKVVPYYIAQIYYLQKNYDAVTDYAQKSNEGAIFNENDMNHLVGDAYYRTGKYDEAVPFLLDYNKTSKTTREDKYCLAYALFQSANYEKAINYFNRIPKNEDSLSQLSFYHIGECYLKLDNQSGARTAFEQASTLTVDPVLQEDALYHYAIISYELDANPYDEAVTAFEYYLDRFPNSKRKQDIFQYLSNVYINTNNYEKALISLDKIEDKDIRLKTAYQTIAYNQGIKRFQDNNFTGAIQSFELAEQHPINPETSALSIYWSAESNFRLKKLDRAEQLFNQFILMPSSKHEAMHQLSFYNLGYVNIEKENYDKAIENFRIFINSSTTDKVRLSDAYLRTADLYYTTRRDNEAIQHYKKVLEIGEGHEDQALFYMAKSYGYKKGETQTKIQHLVDLNKKYPRSKYVQSAILEIGLSYFSIEDWGNSKRYYQKFISEYPSSVGTVEARLQIAEIYFKQKKFAESLESYQSLLADHGNVQSICAPSVRGIIDIYKATGQQDNVVPLLNQYDCAEISMTEKENMYYDPAMSAYTNKEYRKAIDKFEKYLKNFPAGVYQFAVQNYLADCYYLIDEVPTAIEMYRHILEGENTGMTERAAGRVSTYLFNNNLVDEAIPYYERLLEVSIDPEIINNSELGLMRSNFLVENWANSAIYAERVLKQMSLNDENKLEAHYALGLSYSKTGQLDQAKTSLVYVIKNTTTVKRAEATYTLAQIYFEQGYNQQGLDEIKALIKQKPAYNYWIAKGLILKARIKISMDEYFEAEGSLKSIIDHYTKDDDGIVLEAETLLAELMQLQSTGNREEVEVEPEIEINTEKEDGE